MEEVAAILFDHDGVFTEGIYIIMHGYLMAIGCFFLASLHFLKSSHDSGEARKVSRFWKGVSFITLGIGFIISETPYIDPIAARRLLRLLVGIVILSEISYHIPFLFHIIGKWKNRGKHISWMNMQSHWP